MIPKRGKRGFTLIELLIVVAILGVLAAVIIPNVGRFLGRGEQEARRTEFHNVSSAIIAMMVDNGLSEIPAPIILPANATTDMAAFPDSTSAATTVKGYTGLGTPKAGYILYTHDKIGIDTTTFTTVNYVNMSKVKYYYTCEGDGTVHQWSAVSGTEFQY